ncbi:hypothetical protein GCM10011576_52970 [Micromonospora parathelypteridis]|nr:hypothetical protein GCM10011576_52970 [Micromonospora parathelypteridis]
MASSQATVAETVASSTGRQPCRSRSPAVRSPLNRTIATLPHTRWPGFRDPARHRAVNPRRPWVIVSHHTKDLLAGAAPRPARRGGGTG